MEFRDGLPTLFPTGEFNGRDIARYLASVRRDPCSYCGAAVDISKGRGVLDHVLSRKMGGDGRWSNMTAACHSCNSRKLTSTLLGFLACSAYEPERIAAERLYAGLSAYRRVGT